MWEAIADHRKGDLDAADGVYRRWARARMRSGRLIGLIVEVGNEPVATGCVWLMDVQPRPNLKGTTAAYLLSMFTEPGHRGAGHAGRIVRAAIRWGRSRGVPTMMLHASRFGEPIYRRFGFKATKEMRRSLHPHSRGRVRTPKKARRHPSR